jgi:hypothetical protein
MTHDLVLIHRNGSERLVFAADSGDWFSFATCLRHIVIGDADKLEVTREFLNGEDSVLFGEAAYRFLLQVICGLHSPLVGETEVYGQFKQAVATFPLPTTPVGKQLERLFQSLLADAKKIREAHLQDLGSQSYGSLLRRELKGLSRIRILGAGHLVQEILPWLSKDGSIKGSAIKGSAIKGSATTDSAAPDSAATERQIIEIYVRDLAKARRELGRRADDVELHELSQFSKPQQQRAAGETGRAPAANSRVDALIRTPRGGRFDALIIAAPVSAQWLNQWMRAALDDSPQDPKEDSQGEAPVNERGFAFEDGAVGSMGQHSLVIDLRADSSTDPIFGVPKILTLADLLNRISTQQNLICERKALALAAVESCAQERVRHVEYRPFGWDDVCA